MFELLFFYIQTDLKASTSECTKSMLARWLNLYFKFYYRKANGQRNPVSSSKSVQFDPFWKICHLLSQSHLSRGKKAFGENHPGCMLVCCSESLAKHYAIKSQWISLKSMEPRENIYEFYDIMIY